MRRNRHVMRGTELVGPVADAPGSAVVPDRRAKAMGAGHTRGARCDKVCGVMRLKFSIGCDFMKFSKPARGLGLLVMVLLLSSSSATFLLSAEPETVKVYKSATCGCCRKWVDHLKAAGFSVTA